MISNAIKFTENGVVTISGEIYDDAKSNANFLSIKVKDTGVGIKKEDIPNLFNVFGKLDDTAK